MEFYQGEDYYTHLEHEVFFCRQTFAAYLLRDVAFVVEIGAYRTSIAPFLKSQQTCLTIDPDLPHPDGKTRLKATFQGAEIEIPSANYGVALLGLELLDMTEADWHKLYRLINASQTTVIEVSDYDESQRQLKRIVRDVAKTKVWQVVMDLDGNGLDTEFTRRRLYCFR